MPAPSGPQFDPVHAEAAAERARNAARESAAWLRDESSRLLANYQRQSKYFKWRSWIVASYVGLTLVSLLIFGWPSNVIKAHVRVPHDEFDGCPLIHVENQSPDQWTHVKVTVDSQWEIERPMILPGEDITTKIALFRRPNAAAGDPKPTCKMAPSRVRVACDQGSYEYLVNGDDSN